MQKFTKNLIALSVLFGSTDAFAQTDSATVRKLEEVIVTGQYKPQSLKKSVYQVRVITGERIQLSGATNIQQVLNNQLGFRFSNDNTLGITDVKLNGMGGNNVKILLDGIPMVDRYDERVSLSQIDINNVERIEIVEGPMSVSYGSDAMAGVINIITKKNKKDIFSVNASAQEETAGDEYYPFSYKGVHTQNVNINYAKKHLVTAVGGTHNDFDGFGGDSYGRGKTWKPKEQWMGYGKLGYAGNHLHIYYRIDGLKENILSRNPINMNNYKAVDQEYITNRYIHQVQSEYRFNEKIQWSSFVAYTDYQRQTKTTRHNFESNTIEPNQAGEDDISKLNSLAFKTSVQYQLSPKVSLQPGIDINHEKASGARIEGSPEINDYAFFASAEIKPTPSVNIRPGFRISSNSQYDAPPIIPSINTKFVLSKQLDLRLAYGYGFRAPTLRELYLTFFDANHSLIGNTNLKAEYSNSVNGSLTLTPESLKNIGFKSTLSAFYTAYRNQVQLLQSVTNNTEYTYYNTDKSKTLGGSLENQLAWKKLEVSVGFSYTGYSSSQYNDDNYIKEDNRDILWTPEINSEIVYSADKIKTRFGLFYKYIGKKPAFSFGTIDSKDAILLTQTSPYQLADFTITTDINKFFTTHIGVKNIFDVTDVNSNTVSSSNSAHSSSGPLAIGYGRSFFLGLSFKWSK
jgi:outer membrane receptor for ferrienterochelin and colicins